MITFVIGSLLFLRAYYVGTSHRELPPKTDFWDRVVAWLEDHGAFPMALVLAIISAVMFAGVFNGESIGDDLTFHFAESRRLADCIAAGDWDFWNPSANGGYASMYYYQVIPAARVGDPDGAVRRSPVLVPAQLVVAARRGARRRVSRHAHDGRHALASDRGGLRGDVRLRCIAAGAPAPTAPSRSVSTRRPGRSPRCRSGSATALKYLTEGTHLPAAIVWGAFVFLCHPFASIAVCLGLAVGVLALYLQHPVTNPKLRLVLVSVVGLALVVVIARVITDRPQPPENAPDTPVAPIKYMYLPVVLFLVGLLARFAVGGKRLVIVLLAVLGVLLIANLMGFLTREIVPPRPEGATEDLPLQWTLKGASLYVGPILLIVALIARLAMQLVREPASPPAPNPKRAWQILIALAPVGGVLACFALAILKRDLVPIALGLVPLALFAWRAWPVRDEPVIRLVVIGMCLAVATLPGWLTVIVDRDGFGGFPHRVSDEVGPGYQELARWYSTARSSITRACPSSRGRCRSC